MAEETHISEVPPPTQYSFESEPQLFEIPIDSESGKEYRSLQSAEEKIRYLKANGKLTTKEMGGRIMIPQKGAWAHRNVGQIEYLIFAESELGEQYKALMDRGGDVEERREFFEKNVMRIREWPERIVRHQNF